MRARRLTSASRGTLCSVRGSRVRRLAIIRGSAAFLAPLIGIVPFRRWPPTMRIRSMVTLLPHAPNPLRSLSADPRLRSRPEVRLDRAIYSLGLNSVSPHRDPSLGHLLPALLIGPCASIGWRGALARAGHGGRRFPFPLACFDPAACQSYCGSYSTYPTPIFFISFLYSCASLAGSSPCAHFAAMAGSRAYGEAR